MLRANGRPDVPAKYSGATMDRGSGMHMILGTDRSALAGGVAYTLVPLNEQGTNRWAVAVGVSVTR